MQAYKTGVQVSASPPKKPYQLDTAIFLFRTKNKSGLDFSKPRFNQKNRALKSTDVAEVETWQVAPSKQPYITRA